jgi:hypothetical protein
MRAQYKNVGWNTAQNYIMGTPTKTKIINAFNIFKLIIDSESPNNLITRLSEKLKPLEKKTIPNLNKNNDMDIDKTDNKNNKIIYTNYLHYFKENHYLN